MSEIITILKGGKKPRFFKPARGRVFTQDIPIRELRDSHNDHLLEPISCDQIERGEDTFSIIGGEIQPGHELCPVALLAQSLGAKRLLCHKPIPRAEAPAIAANAMKEKLIKQPSNITPTVLTRIFPGHTTDFIVISCPTDSPPEETSFTSDSQFIHALSCGKDDQIMNAGEPVVSIYNGRASCGYERCALRARLLEVGVTYMVCARTIPRLSNREMVEKIKADEYFNV